MTNKKEEKTSPAPQQLSFEKALERLETIVREMEGGSLSLEKMMDHFVEGSGLVKFCNEKLHEVEHKIEILVKKGDEVTTETFPVPKS